MRSPIKPSPYVALAAILIISAAQPGSQHEDLRLVVYVAEPDNCGTATLFTVLFCLVLL